LGRKKELPLIEGVEILDITAEGNALAKVDNKVLFVPQAIPGDIVDVQIRKKRTSYMEGVIVRIKQPSPLRIEPFCEHFGVCGGCKWQHLPYPEQLKYKQIEVVQNLERIGKVDIEKIHNIIPSDKTKFYRNKLEYTFSDNRWLSQEEIDGETYVKKNGLGFHVPGMFDKVLDINFCHLQPEPSNEIRVAVREYALKHNLTFFNLKTHEGFLRNLIIRTSSTGEVMVIVVFFYEEKEERKKLLNYLVKHFPQITSLIYIINPKHNDTINDLELNTFHGQDHIYEEMEGLKFKIGPKSFYQTNSEQAYKLYSATRKMAKLTGHELVYDLYTGTGTIANFIARDAGSVIGIEYVPEAIEDAIENSHVNNIKNTRFYAGDMKDILTNEFVSIHGRPDVIILDPPRAGVHPSVIESILFAYPKRIVYVSCNSATQARDINLLSNQYTVKEIMPFDMFPHTHHVENIALLELKK
jgi:23S rRNA (uracil1939-C5)-methyltransferase